MEKIKMRSRQFPDLTNWEIEQYLQRNDLIIVPVGHCECLGATPVDGEYVASHAWANLIAEYADGLVLPNVQYTCAGGTQNGQGTVYMSASDSFHHCLALAHSLLIQGFKTQIWIPSHGPTMMFLSAMVTQFFDETKISALYLEPQTLMQNMGLIEPFDISQRTQPKPITLKDGTPVLGKDREIGAYQIVKRLDIYPAKGEVDFPPAEVKTMRDNFAPWFTDECERVMQCSAHGVLPAPTYFEYTRQHGGDPVALYTREELQERANVGEAYLREMAEAMDFPGLVAGLKKLNKVYMQGSAIPKNANHLPPNKYAPIWFRD